jgi:hypothetical protein
MFGIGILLAAIAQHQNLMISWNESETPMLERTGDNVSILLKNWKADI